MEKLLRLSHTPEEEKIEIVSYYLKGAANDWWTIAQEAFKTTPGYGWNEFRASHEKKYYPPAMKHQKEQEFHNQEMGAMTLTEYTRKFDELSKFAKRLVPDEETRINQYVRQMEPSLNQLMVGHDFPTFQAAYKKAMAILAAIQNADKNKKKTFTPTVSHNSFIQKPLYQKPHYPKPLYQKPRHQKPFHQKSKPFAKKFQANLSNKIFPKGDNTEEGHKSYVCPKKTGTPLIQGRAYMMIDCGEEEQADTITGKFLVNSCMAFILFDTGASLSHVSPTFIAKAKLPNPEAIHASIAIPNGQTLNCKARYRGVPVIILGSTFPANLISLDLPGFDIILGMDWLAKYHAKFECRGQNISLRISLRARVTYKGYKPNTRVKVINVMKLASQMRKGEHTFLCNINSIGGEKLRIEDIPVVREFPEVFPEELPGIPPERDVEFSIDLVSGTAPI
ncbi:uncharacterized protein LOC141595500 [Silene latifolia]|uniref:uncharacterized protein LOC141595500 n=1 Tax=Silene latifolia TaxID=37657 RepID=UPI003D77A207